MLDGYDMLLGSDTKLASLYTAMMRSLIISSVLATGALAQSGAYGQCGGTGYTVRV